MRLVDAPGVCARQSSALSQCSDSLLLGLMAPFSLGHCWLPRRITHGGRRRLDLNGVNENRRDDGRFAGKPPSQDAA